MKRHFDKLLFFGLFSITLHAEDLKLEKMAMSLSGKAAMPMSINRHNEFSLSTDLAPRFGIFLTDNLELGAELFTQFNFIFSTLPRIAPTPIKWGVSGEVLYYFKTPSRFTPYVGAGLGFRIMNWSLLSTNLCWSTPVGTLVALEKNFAVELGIAIRGFMSLRSLAEKIEFVPGFIGFRYFFS